MEIPKVFVVGVGMTRFEKPGKRKNFGYPQMIKEAVAKALLDAGIEISDIQQACVGYVYGDLNCGQRTLYDIKMTGIPIFNIHNNGCTGATSLILAKQLVQSGNSNCVLALGFDKMEQGPLKSMFDDRTNSSDRHLKVMTELAGMDTNPVVAQIFGNAGIEHMKRYGTKPEHFAKIAYKNHKHSVNNMYSQYQEEYSLDDILKSPQVYGPLTKLQCYPTSDGSAAVIIASEEFVFKHELQKQAVEILGIEISTDLPSMFREDSFIKLIGYDKTKNAAGKLFSKTGFKPEDIDVIELHDCFSANELITYEALGLCPPGKAKEFIDAGMNTYGGKVVVNPSGGLISKGHPIGATGVAQCVELCWQLRGLAGKRQVPQAKIALQHTIGLGGAAVVALYRLGFPPSKRLVAPTNLVNNCSNPFISRSVTLSEVSEETKVNIDDVMEDVSAIYRLRGGKGLWSLNAKTVKDKLEYNSKDEPDVMFTICCEDFNNLLSEKLIFRNAFSQNKMTVQENITFNSKLIEFQKSNRKNINELSSKL